MCKGGNVNRGKSQGSSVVLDETRRIDALLGKGVPGIINASEILLFYGTVIGF